MSIVNLLFHDVYDRAPSESGFRSSAADRYKLTTGQLESQLAGLNRLACCVRPDFAPAHAHVNGARGFSITVDDGGVSYYTTIADRLEARGWRGACFVSTNFIGTSGFLSVAQIRELDRRGHLIGSHSASHPTRFSACRIEEMRREWRDSRACLEDLLGHEVNTASLPGGYFSRNVARTAADEGYDFLYTSEPSTGVWCVEGCVVTGRFTIRRDARHGLARALVRDPWTRWAARAQWRTKNLVKPLLGRSYPYITEFLSSARSVG